MPRADRKSPEPDIASLRNLGPKSAAMLASVGITTLAQLRKAGAVAAYVAVKRQQSAASLNLLYALVGMLEDCDWKTAQRERKLELMLAVEDYERQYPLSNGGKQDALLQLRNIGKAMRTDFELLGISNVEQLAHCDADELYARIQQLTGSRHDPCVWDTYAAAIHQARTGEALAWWTFTKVRKARQTQGTFMQQKPPHPAGSRQGRGKNIENPEVAARFNAYPATIRTKLMALRKMILEVAAATDGIGELEEALKWGQPGYLTTQTKSGSLIRLDQHGATPTHYAIYFHCQTTLVDTFRTLYRNQFKFEGNRCIVFDLHKPVPIRALRHCIELALTYHLRKQAAGSQAR